MKEEWACPNCHVTYSPIPEIIDDIENIEGNKTAMAVYKEKVKEFLKQPHNVWSHAPWYPCTFGEHYMQCKHCGKKDYIEVVK